MKKKKIELTGLIASIMVLFLPFYGSYESTFFSRLFYGSYEPTFLSRQFSVSKELDLFRYAQVMFLLSIVLMSLGYLYKSDFAKRVASILSCSSAALALADIIYQWSLESMHVGIWLWIISGIVMSLSYKRPSINKVKAAIKEKNRVQNWFIILIVLKVILMLCLELGSRRVVSLDRYQMSSIIGLLNALSLMLSIWLIISLDGLRGKDRILLLASCLYLNLGVIFEGLFLKFDYSTSRDIIHIISNIKYWFSNIIIITIIVWAFLNEHVKGKYKVTILSITGVHFCVRLLGILKIFYLTYIESYILFSSPFKLIILYAVYKSFQYIKEENLELESVS